MKSLSDLLGRTLGDTGSAVALAPVWQRVVGDLIGRHTRPTRWDGTTLVIACDAASWKDALEPERASLARRLSHATGESRVESIVFEVIS